MLYARTVDGRNVTVDLSPLKFDALHMLFSTHFQRAHVDPPHVTVRTWRRFFGWAYGMSTFEAAALFVGAGAVLAVVCYALCCRYTLLCDSIQDL